MGWVVPRVTWAAKTYAAFSARTTTTTAPKWLLLYPEHCMLPLDAPQEKEHPLFPLPLSKGIDLLSSVAMGSNTELLQLSDSVP